MGVAVDSSPSERLGRNGLPPRVVHTSCIPPSSASNVSEGLLWFLVGRAGSEAALLDSLVARESRPMQRVRRFLARIGHDGSAQDQDSCFQLFYSDSPVLSVRGDAAAGLVASCSFPGGALDLERFRVVPSVAGNQGPDLVSIVAVQPPALSSLELAMTNRIPGELHGNDVDYSGPVKRNPPLVIMEGGWAIGGAPGLREIRRRRAEWAASTLDWRAGSTLCFTKSLPLS